MRDGTVPRGARLARACRWSSAWNGWASSMQSSAHRSRFSAHTAHMVDRFNGADKNLFRIAAAQNASCRSSIRPCGPAMTTSSNWA